MSDPKVGEDVFVTVFLHGVTTRPIDIDAMTPDELRRFCRDLLERNGKLWDDIEEQAKEIDKLNERIRKLKAAK